MENKTTQLTPAQQNIVTFKNKVNGNYVQTQLRQVLKENAGTFATSLMEVYTNDRQLQTCDPNKVVQEAIKAASLKLPINKQLGYAYLLTFNNWDKQTRTKVPTPTLVIGYKGYIQLAMRTGMYRSINSGYLTEGQYAGCNLLTGDIKFNESAPESNRIEGFFAYFELTNGFRKMLYTPIRKMAKFALEKSPSFRYKPTPDNPLPTVDELVDMANRQLETGETGQVGWKGDFISMGEKTVLRHLLSKYGYLSIEMQNALSEEAKAEDFTTAEEIRESDNAAPKPTFSNVIQDAQAEEIPANDPGDAPI